MGPGTFLTKFLTQHRGKCFLLELFIMVSGHAFAS